MQWKTLVGVPSLLLVLVCGATRDPQESQAGLPGSRPAAGTVTGKVVLNGKAPVRRRIQVTEPVCQAKYGDDNPLLSEELVVSPTGEIRNVVVRVVKGMADKEFTVVQPAPVLDQLDCRFAPHVLAMLPGNLTVTNSDATLHNVHSQGLINRNFNKAQPAKGRKDSFALQRPEVVKITCDVHGWMSAYVVVCDNPCFAVTGDDGSFTLKAPPGRYTLQAWHEKLGTQVAEVTVVAGKAARQHFTFDGAALGHEEPQVAGRLGGRAPAAPLPPAAPRPLPPASRPVAPATRPVAPASRPDAGTVTGKAVLDGTPPKRRKIVVAAEAVCRAMHPDDKPLLSEDVIASPTGELRNVVVRIVKGMEGKAFQVELPPPLLDQVGCQYVPHVQAMLAGALTVLNSDETLHNVHSRSELNQEFNKGQALKGKRDVFELRRPEVVRITCDVHGWMSAYVVVCDNPCFAVTGDDGSFSFLAPPGKYTLEAWHEKLGTQVAEVTVVAGQPTKQYFTFQQK